MAAATGDGAVETEGRSGGSSRRRTVLVSVGVSMSVIGFLDGLVLMLKRRESDCADGTFFPNGTTDFRCYAHPGLGVGLAICAISVMLGVLILLVAPPPPRDD